MTDVQKLKELRRLTNAGLADCKRALADANNDLFAAATSMLTEEEALKLQQSVRVRSMAGQSIKDPVSAAEQQFVDALVSYYIAERTRPPHVLYLFELTRLFSSDVNFRVSMEEQPNPALGKLWYAFSKTEEEIPTGNTFQDSRSLTTVITMPTSQSEWECDFVVLRHPRRRIVFSSSPKILAIYKRTSRDDHGIVDIDEMAVKNGDALTKSRWVMKDAKFDEASLVRLDLSQVTRIQL